MAGSRMQRLAVWVPLTAAAAWLVFRAWYYSGWMDDDAFISFRYARNLAHGLGLVFNAGERVEGYTNFLWTLTLAAAARLGLDVPATAQALGVVLAVASLVWVTRLARLALHDTRAPGWLALVPALLLAVSESWAVWAVSGLENVAATFLLLLAADAFARSETAANPRAMLARAAVFASLAAMTHPAHVLAAGALSLLAALDAWRGRRPWRDVGVFVAVVAALFGTFFLWRALYYGALFPNTFYAKVGASGSLLERGFAYLGGVARAFPLLLAGAAVRAAVRARQRPRNPAIAACLALTTVNLLYLVAIGGDAFPAYRAFVASLPFTAILATHALALLAGSAAASPPQPPRAAPLAIAAAAVIAVTAAAAWIAPATRKLDAAIARDALTAYRTAGEWMRQNFAPGATLAYSGAGVIAYYGEMPFIDTLGLTDAHIARAHVGDIGRGMAGHERGDGRYVLERRPEWIMFTGAPFPSHAPNFKTDHELVALQEFHFQYRPLRVPLRYVTRRGARPMQFDLLLYRRADSR